MAKINVNRLAHSKIFPFLYYTERKEIDGGQYTQAACVHSFDDFCAKLKGEFEEKKSKEYFVDVTKNAISILHYDGEKWSNDCRDLYLSPGKYKLVRVEG